MEMIEQFMEFMKIMEEDYKCSGICEKEDIFYFSDVNEKVEKPCYKDIGGGILQGLFGNYGIIFIVSAVIILIGWCVNWGLCKG